MTPEVLHALINAASVILSGLIAAIVSNKLMAYRIEQLEKKVDKHNSVIDRTYHLKSTTKIMAACFNYDFWRDGFSCKIKA